MAQEISSSTSDYSVLSQVSLGGTGDSLPNESSNIFADDEMDSPSIVLVPRRENYCFRCRITLETRARMCRNCYNERRQWMPPRPTRKLRKKRRIPVRKRSLLNKYLSLQESTPSGLQHFNRLSTTSNKSVVSSESSLDFQKGRAEEWRNRKVVMQRHNFPYDSEKSSTPNEKFDEA